MTATDGDFRSLFNGETLAGWRVIPRLYGSAWPGGPSGYHGKHPEGAPELASQYPAEWAVEDGVIVGRQNSHVEDYGGYLLSEETFGDFELVLEMKPDWPADTGVMLRRRPNSYHGFQVLVDFREEGSVGGFYGNGLASFHAMPFALDVSRDANGDPDGLLEFGPAQHPYMAGFTEHKRSLLRHAADFESFRRVWKWNDWNELRVLCVGPLPVITTWINGLKIAEIDTATIDWPHYEPEGVLRKLGDRGHLALEVHDRDPKMEGKQWGPGAECRWKNIRIRDIAPPER